MDSNGVTSHSNMRASREIWQFRRQALPLEDLPIPPPGKIHLWLLDLARLATPLGTPEPGTALRPRQSRSTRRFYLRLLLGAYLGLPGKDVRISRINKGKPVLDASWHPQTLHFSSAASGSCCLIGVTSEGPLGVDLELAERTTLKPRALARRYFSPAEQQGLDSIAEADIHRAFIHCWACKEAVVKAAGLGIANQLCRFTVNTDPGQTPALLELEGDDAAAWSLAVLRPDPAYLAAVALRQPVLRIEGFKLLPPSQ